ncbi:hypothetical protein [uncultured Roseobacter sp.]|uniref:hypothetical protein n=1 Tax=uncultured Roseobacter sp. TaxID=114847 RepID=UPI002625F697|nr:hypothetical protein [uncultured Roseobacter sp.]
MLQYSLYDPSGGAITPTRQHGLGDALGLLPEVTRKSAIHFGQSNSNDVQMTFFPHSVYLFATDVGFLGRAAENCTRFMYQQGAQISVTAFADARQTSLSTA